MQLFYNKIVIISWKRRFYREFLLIRGGDIGQATNIIYKINLVNIK